MPPVIAISGPPGAGKTRLIEALARRLSPAAVIEFDRYEQATDRPPAETAAWLERGGLYDELPLGPIADDLAILREGGMPDGARPPTPVRAVLFDTLVGRAHTATAPLIDRLVWVDLPLDLALARKIGGLAAHAATDSHPMASRHFVTWLAGYLDQYAGFIRGTYQLQQERVRPGADLIVDGTATPEVLAGQVLADLVTSGLVGGRSDAP